MRIAIVHHWFLASGGGETTANVLAEMYPDADIFTLLYEETCLPSHIRGRAVRASWLQCLPMKYKVYRYFLALFPLACRSLDLHGYELVITSDCSLMKGVRLDEGAVQICYCYSPMRCLYDQYSYFRGQVPWVLRPLFAWVAKRLRRWDFQAAQRVTQFVADSEHIVRRIEAVYGREAVVVYPPVETRDLGVEAEEGGNFYLSAGRLTETKWVDLLIQACNELGRPLVVAGSGRQRAELERLAGPTVKFAGQVSDEELGRLYAGCRAFLFCAEEDFGMVIVEAQVQGRPVIAYGRGGALETVVEDVTGIFFDAQTVEAIKEAILRFELIEAQFDPKTIREAAGRFAVSTFMAGIRAAVEAVYPVATRER